MNRYEIKGIKWASAISAIGILFVLPALLFPNPDDISPLLFSAVVFISIPILLIGVLLTKAIGMSIFDSPVTVLVIAVIANVIVGALIGRLIAAKKKADSQSHSGTNATPPRS